MGGRVRSWRGLTRSGLALSRQALDVFEVVLGEGVALVVVEPEPGGDPPGGPGFQVSQCLVVTAPAKPPQRQVFLASAQHLPGRRVEIVQGEGEPVQRAGRHQRRHPDRRRAGRRAENAQRG